MAVTLIRQAGPYTVTTDGARYLVNGQQATPVAAPAGSGLALALDTGIVGSNGKRDVVGLKPEHVAIHTAAVQARTEADLASPKSQRVALLMEIDAAEEAKHDAVETLRTTGRGSNPAPVLARVEAAYAALASFDAAHPELAAERAAERARLAEMGRND